MEFQQILLLGVIGGFPEQVVGDVDERAVEILLQRMLPD